MNCWIYWIYGTDSFDGKEFAIDGATQHIHMYNGIARPGVVAREVAEDARELGLADLVFHSIPVAIPPRWWRWRRAHINIGQFISPRNCLYRNVPPLIPPRSEETFLVLVGALLTSPSDSYNI